MKDTLQLVPDFWYKDSRRAQAEKLIKEALNTDFNSWWYLHGDLESECGYDKGTFINLPDELITTQPIRWTYLVGNTIKEWRDEPIDRIYANGIFDVEVLILGKSAIAYLWTTEEKMIHNNKHEFLDWKQRGLVVLKNDVEANEYALKKYNEKTDMI